MAKTIDGFVLAQRDLQRVDQGISGTRQSGYAKLQMANLNGYFYVEKAGHEAQALFERDPELTDSPKMKRLPVPSAGSGGWGAET